MLSHCSRRLQPCRRHGKGPVNRWPSFCVGQYFFIEIRGLAGDIDTNFTPTLLNTAVNNFVRSYGVATAVGDFRTSLRRDGDHTETDAGVKSANSQITSFGLVVAVGRLVIDRQYYHYSFNSERMAVSWRKMAVLRSCWVKPSWRCWLIALYYLPLLISDSGR